MNTFCAISSKAVIIFFNGEVVIPIKHNRFNKKILYIAIKIDKFIYRDILVESNKEGLIKEINLKLSQTNVILSKMDKL